jgi:glycosyltransferase 2 family protein
VLYGAILLVTARIESPSFFRRHAGKFAASFLITFGIVYTVHKGGLKLVPEGGDFEHVRPWTVPAYMATLGAVAWFRSVRWRFLLRSIADVPKKRLFSVSCVGFAAILLLPFRIGEFVRPYLIRTRAGDPEAQRQRPISLTAATSTVVAERVIDGLYLSVVLAVALVLVPTVVPLPDRVVGLPVTVAHVRMSGYAMFGLFTVAFATIVVFYFARSWAHRTTLAVVGKVSIRLAERLARMAEKFADGLHVFGHRRNALGFLTETSLYWLTNAMGMWLLAWGCGVVHADGSPATFGECCALMGMLGCAILIPGPPGMLGVFQAGIYAGMTMFYPSSVVTGAGAAYVFLMYASQCCFTIVMGGIGLAMDRGGGLRALEEPEGVAAASVDAA